MGLESCSVVWMSTCVVRLGMNNGQDFLQLRKRLEVASEGVLESITKRALAHHEQDQVNIASFFQRVKDVGHVNFVIAFGVVEAWCIIQVEPDLRLRVACVSSTSDSIFASRWDAYVQGVLVIVDAHLSIFYGWIGSGRICALDVEHLKGR